ncbi:hypothetical protein X975_18747, partial [Stegodyphus mimosarum]
MDVCKCIVSVRHEGTQNMRQTESPLERLVIGKDGRTTLGVVTPGCFPPKLGAEMSNVALSPVRYPRL